MFDYTSYQLHHADLLRAAEAERLARTAIAGRRVQRREEFSRRLVRIQQARWARAA